MTASPSQPDERRPAEGRRPWEPPTVKVLGSIPDVVRGEEKKSQPGDH